MTSTTPSAGSGTAPAPHTLLGLALGFVGVVIFGATLPATRVAVGHMDPWFVALGRAAAAGLIAVAVLAVLRRPLPPRRDLSRYAVVALCLIAGFPGFSSLAMVTVPASHGGVVIGILPLGTAIAAALVARERPSIGFWLTGLAGAALVLVFTFRQAGGFHVSPGDLFLVVAVAAAAIGYTVSGMLTRTRPGWEVVSWMLVLALPVTLPLAWWLAPAEPASVPAAAWWSFAYVALFSQYLGFFFWNAGLALGGIARVGQIQLLQPFVTLGIAATLNREPVGADTLLFAVAVAACVLAGSRMKAR
ncbi:MAG: DMT family transporter [Phreatobacter sp.]|uniref:DMT family transporter n=1 Tax=Phreatobacter sp. TaxID=1966341 RepID=UPI001A5A6E0B|nr:DMT family transporter [Phreatobacter sp.]MBL8568569.1 DMT family transporter [Phreatobacter sp.]